MKIKCDGIIFDVDGTLWDSTYVVKDAWNQAIMDVGYDNPNITADRLKGLFGLPMDDIIKDIMPELSREERDTIAPTVYRYEDEYLVKKSGLLYDKIIDVIIELSKIQKKSHIEEKIVILHLDYADNNTHLFLGLYRIAFPCDVAFFASCFGQRRLFSWPAQVALACGGLWYDWRFALGRYFYVGPGRGLLWPIHLSAFSLWLCDWLCGNRVLVVAALLQTQSHFYL